MLTLRKMSVFLGDRAGASRVAQYVLEPPADGRPPRTAWLGSEAALGRYGVRRGGPVALEQLIAALQGRHVGGEAQVRIPGKARRGSGTAPCIASLDLTFSAPKSVSVLWSQAPDPTRQQIEQAMLVAADHVLQYMALTKPVVYRRLGGRRVGEPAAGFIAAACLHLISRRARAEDFPAPQLHVHAILLGVERGDGSVVAPNSSGLYKRSAPLEGGAIGRAVLADQLVGLGCSLRPATGRRGRFFEVEGVPEGLLEAASQRTREVQAAIERITRERGAPRGGAVAVAALETRQAKDPHLDPPQLAAAWGAIAAVHDFGPREAAALCANGSYPESLAARRVAAERALRERLAAAGPTIALGEARAAAFEIAPGRLHVAAANELLRALERGGELVALDGERATVAPRAELERRLLASAREAGLSSGGRWTALIGPSGAARDQALLSQLAAGKGRGSQVLACAPSAAAAYALRAAFEARSYSAAALVRKLELGSLALGSGTLLVLADADRLGPALWAEIVERCREGAPALLAVASAQPEPGSSPFGALLAAGAFEVEELPGAGAERAGDEEDEEGPSAGIAVELPRFEPLPPLCGQGAAAA